jgi:hypothetical protein
MKVLEHLHHYFQLFNVPTHMYPLIFKYLDCRHWVTTVENVGLLFFFFTKKQIIQRFLDLKKVSRICSDCNVDMISCDMYSSDIYYLNRTTCRTCNSTICIECSNKYKCRYCAHYCSRCVVRCWMCKKYKCKKKCSSIKDACLECVSFNYKLHEKREFYRNGR